MFKKGLPAVDMLAGGEPDTTAAHLLLELKLMSCSHVKSYVKLLTWLLIGCSLLCSQSGACLLVDTTLDNDYNS